METKTIKKEIAINAPKQNVWEVLFSDHYTRIWYNAFNEGAYAKTDWKLGSKALFMDQSGSGLVGRIVVNQPFEALTIEYDGVVHDGVEDTSSKEAIQFKGGQESYHLSEKNQETHLSISGDISEAFYDIMSQAWDKALLKIKELSETK